jgi:hypothetical protein
MKTMLLISAMLVTGFFATGIAAATPPSLCTVEQLVGACGTPSSDCPGLPPRVGNCIVCWYYPDTGEIRCEWQ